MERHTATFRHLKHRVKNVDEWPGAWGLCDVEDDVLIIYRGQRDKSLLDTLIHEGLHASFPHMSEERVTRAATDLARFVWGYGYRRRKQI